MKLIAKVTVDVFVKGVRTQFAPGEEVIGLSRVDVADLKTVGAIEDQDETDAATKKDELAEKKAGKEFADARKAIQASQAAIEAPDQPDESPAA